MHAGEDRRRPGEVVALRYVTTDGRIEMCWPCRVVEDAEHLVALYIAAGSRYKADPKMSAAAKRTAVRHAVPRNERVWRTDTLRLMLANASHSVSLFFEGEGADRRLLRYFVNMEEPFRRTACGFDTQDHTLDIVVLPTLEWLWRDEQELANHVLAGYYTAALAAEARAEGLRVIDAIRRGTHPCLRGWAHWRPETSWTVPTHEPGWDTTPATSWERRVWAYGDDALGR